jgi:CHAT domain-containing protein
MLILAGGDKDKKNNLTLKEIFANLKIPNARAAVLSACETGMVELESGDEYIGLASGFMYAGSPTVISSLWSVDDLSTSLLMNRWYENVLTNKMGKAAALKEAQQWVRDLTGAKLIEYWKKYPSQDPHVRAYKRAIQLLSPEKKEEKRFAHPFYWGAFTCTGNWM